MLGMNECLKAGDSVIAQPLEHARAGFEGVAVALMLSTDNPGDISDPRPFIHSHC